MESEGSKDRREIVGNGRGLYGERIRLDPASGRTVKAVTAFRIDNPDVGHSHAAIVVETLLIAGNTIFRRKHLDDCEGRTLDDRFRSPFTRNKTNIRHTETGRRNSYSNFGERPDVPFLAVISKPLD